ncbi:MAG: TrmB family transcriptional regulator [Methanosphaera stadtmanae]|nr:TrmB family transcriptional regulator [Methanosphaera stadtmanae]
MTENIIKLLKQYGFTEYESKAYLSLSSLISATADEISKNSGVPRSKIYSTLELLEKKGFIHIKESRPLVYIMIQPEESLKNYKNKLLDDFHIIENYITDLYDSKIPKQNTPIFSIEDEKQILQKEEDILKRTKKVLCIRLGFVIPSEVGKLRRTISKLLKKGVQIKILTLKECIVNNTTVNIIDIFEGLDVEIKYANIPAARLIIRDYKEMILTFAENSSKSIDNSNMIGLVNTNSTIISNYTSAFNKQWGKM